MVEEKTWIVNGTKNKPDGWTVRAKTAFDAAVISIDELMHWSDALEIVRESGDIPLYVWEVGENKPMRLFEMSVTFDQRCTGGWEMCTKCGCALCTCKCHER